SADAARHKELQQELKKFDKVKPAPLPVGMGLQDVSAIGPTTYLLVRGELSQPGDEVTPGMPVILTPGFRETPAKIEPLGERPTAAPRWRTGWPRRTTRSPPACSSIACGSTISPAASCPAPAISASAAKPPPIPSCSTGWPRSSSAPAGTSSTCTG